METRAGQGAKLLEDVLSYIQEHMTDIQAKIRFSASGVSILSVCDWRGKCTETVFVVQRSI